MVFYKIIIWNVFFLLIHLSFNTGIYSQILNEQKPVKISAFIRVKNEINTIEACLNSIDGLFDRIVMIYSNEKDDGSVAIMQKWCGSRINCEIYEYPHAVIPAYDARYETREYAPENSLAAYYNFGLEKFTPDEFVTKIDADQVYLKEELKKALDVVREASLIDDKFLYGIKGYNTFVYENKLVSFKPHLMNGGDDHFIIKRKYINYFRQDNLWERIRFNQPISFRIFKGSYWFHFRKTVNINNQDLPLKDLPEGIIEPLAEKEKDIFNTHIRPYLINSSYYSVGF